MSRLTLQERLMSKLVPIPESGCFIFTGATEKFGYGKMATRAGHIERTHRIAWMLEHGEIPNGMCVLHRCDVPSCCNINHLFLGNKDDNNKDKMKKLRASKKLTKDKIYEIRNDTRFLKYISFDYGISESMVSMIKNNKVWSFL